MKWLAVLAIFIFGALVYVADRALLPDWIASLIAYPGGDKLGHLLIVGCLAVLFNQGLSWRTLPFRSGRILVGNAVLASLVTLEEVSQLFVPSRSFSLVDLGFSFLGLLLAAALHGMLRKDVSLVY